jgi:hypothetical protein
VIYDRFGRVALRFALRYLRVRYRRELRIGAGVGVAALALGAAAYLSRREVPEG